MTGQLGSALDGLLCMMQKSDRPGAFVGILRAGLGAYLEQAVGLLGKETAPSEKVYACEPTAIHSPPHLRTP